MMWRLDPLTSLPLPQPYLSLMPLTVRQTVRPTRRKSSSSPATYPSPLTKPTQFSQQAKYLGITLGKDVSVQEAFKRPLQKLSQRLADFQPMQLGANLFKIDISSPMQQQRYRRPRRVQTSARLTRHPLARRFRMVERLRFPWCGPLFFDLNQESAHLTQA